MIVIFVAIVVAFAALEMLSGFLVDETLRVVLSLLITSICILGYKVPGLGYVLKFLTSVIFSYKLLLPLVTWIVSAFWEDEKLVIVQIIGLLTGAGIITKWQIYATEYTFLHTDSVEIYEVKLFFSRWKYNMPKFRLPKLNFDVAREERKLAHQKTIEEQMRRQFEQLKEERERFEELKAKFEREKRDMNIKQEQETIGFFDGCKNEEEIKARYRKLVQEYHPDGTRGNAEMFKKIQAEYERLTNRCRCQGEW